MLSINKRTELRNTFEKLSSLERQLIALKSICHEFTGWKGTNDKYIATITQSEIIDSQGKTLTADSYKRMTEQLMKLGFSPKQPIFNILPELHHDLLVLMTTDEMSWVVSMVGVLYPKKTTDFIQRDYNHRRSNDGHRANLMAALYVNNSDYFLLKSTHPGYYTGLVRYLQNIFCDLSIDIDWLRSRNPIIRTFICIALLASYYCDEQSSKNSDDVLAVFCELNLEGVSHDYLHYYSALIHCSRGALDKVTQHIAHIKDTKSGLSLQLHATYALLTGKPEIASTLYRKALTASRKQYDSRTFYFDNIVGIFHCLCLAYVENNVAQIHTHITQYDRYADGNLIMKMHMAYDLVCLVDFIEKGQHKAAEGHLSNILKAHKNAVNQPLSMMLYHILLRMVNQNNLSERDKTLYDLAQLYTKKNHHTAAHIAYELLSKSEKYQTQAIAFLEKSGIKLKFLNLINIKEEWEYSFHALEGLLLEGGSQNTPAPKSKRLLWLLDVDKYVIDVVEQSTIKSGWSQGKSISLNKLKHYSQHEQFEYLSAEDKLVIHCITDDGYYYCFDPYQTILALIGHKNIVHYKNRSVSIELTRGEPELLIEENKKGYHFSLSHWRPKASLIIEPVSLNQYRVIDFSMDFCNIGKILTEKGLTIPAIAKEKVLSVIQNAKRDINIHVGIKDIDILEIAGDPTPYIQLLPTKEGVRATLWVRPLLDQGTYFKIGEGKDSVMMLHTENGQETRARLMRDLAREKANLIHLTKQCQHLTHHEFEPGAYEIDNVEDTLEVLSELQEYASAHPLMIEWPQGQTFKIKQRVFNKSLSLNISSANNWFEYKGEFTLSDGEILSMEALLEGLETQSYGRFVRLGNGEFIELTSQLKKQLSLLKTISEDNRINPLGAQVLSDIVADAENITFDKGWEAHLKKIRTMEKHAPTVPSTLQATLRDYQIEGFQYLSRLTNWGIGACLADDMGLGKTIQTIALLLERGKNGPSLVIAPTSVAFNWIEELNKFAPTLNVYNFNSGDREELIKNASKFDVVICSYGLLQHNDNLLTQKQWEIAVLDEAQAIKNPMTQRWKTVMKLKAAARIALSGTPIENHLGELWSIFAFINPGLLGTIKSFQTKYSTPIESREAPNKVHALRSLVSPYILRRIKSEVLTELPPKTEQTIHIEQSPEEAVFYEALRRRAEERMTHFMEENNRIGVLTEITKLRQACCDSSMVDNSISIENSKLHSFIETLKNIIDNGHKALVFSQYVTFLQIVKKRIETEKISYQYLDGSTTAANRKKSVNAFQSGEGDVFLLSLKAGGSGLNLTAADYVIHLDPWWNPAVEDQASDRAHRIGQERPVTIYRFIVQNTIEEKILSMHEHKRNLANELLNGQGITGKLSNEDLMNLISA